MRTARALPLQASSIKDDKGYALSVRQNTLDLDEALTSNIRDASSRALPPVPSSPSPSTSRGVASPLHQQPPAPPLKEEGDVFDDALEHHQHHNIGYEVNSEDDEEDDDDDDDLMLGANGLVEEAGYLDEEEDPPLTNIPPAPTPPTSTLDSDFASAGTYASTLPSLPPATQQAIYGTYKCATVGAPTSLRPGVFNPVGRAKWDGWSEKYGVLDTKEKAKVAYVELIKELSKGAFTPAEDHVKEKPVFLQILDKEDATEKVRVC